MLVILTLSPVELGRTPAFCFCCCPCSCAFLLCGLPGIVILSEAVRVFAKGVVEGPAVAVICSLLRLPLSVLSSHPTKPVISTEAAHSLIVSSAAEKSASPPKQHPSHRRCCCFCRCRSSWPLSQICHPERSRSRFCERHSRRTCGCFCWCPINRALHDGCEEQGPAPSRSRCCWLLLRNLVL
jgi:hypothetical protein